MERKQIRPKIVSDVRTLPAIVRKILDTIPDYCWLELPLKLPLICMNCKLFQGTLWKKEEGRNLLKSSCDLSATFITCFRGAQDRVHSRVVASRGFKLKSHYAWCVYEFDP